MRLASSWGFPRPVSSPVSLDTPSRLEVGFRFLTSRDIAGIIFVFSMYYKRNERHWRVAVFFGGAALAGALGGILAWGIGHIQGGGLPSWA